MNEELSMETRSTWRGAWKAGGMVALLALAAGCGDGVTGPGSPGTRAVSLSVGLASPSAPLADLFAQGLELSDGTNTLVVESAELVLREIKFERVGTSGCDSEMSGGADDMGADDDCDEFEVGPFLVALPLDGSVTKELTAQVDTGTYHEIELEIHKPEDNTAVDLDFIDQHPAFADVSIRVTGTYNGQPFTYVTDLNAEQEIELASPLIVDAGAGPINVTLTIDLSSWFKDATGVLIDPASALKGQPNEQLVESNIEGSIRGFGDNDGNGRADDDS